MDGDGGTGGLADGAGSFADGSGGFPDGAGGLDDVAVAAAAEASAAQPLSPSLSPNVSATGLCPPAAAGGAAAPLVWTPPVVWDALPVWGGHDGHRSGGGRAVCRHTRRTICAYVYIPRKRWLATHRRRRRLVRVAAAAVAEAVAAARPASADAAYLSSCESGFLVPQVQGVYANALALISVAWNSVDSLTLRRRDECKLTQVGHGRGRGGGRVECRGERLARSGSCGGHCSL